MGLVGIVGTVKVSKAGGSLYVVIPSKCIQDLLLQKGDTMIVRLNGKDIKYRKIE